MPDVRLRKVLYAVRQHPFAEGGVRVRGQARTTEFQTFHDPHLQEKLGVSLHPEKTRIVHVADGFEFLGYSMLRSVGRTNDRF